MAADTTKVAINSAGAWVHLYGLVVAARVAANQPPIPTSAARRLTFLASAALRLTTDPTPNPVGILLDVDIPYSQESGIGPCGEDIRKWYIKGVASLEVTQEY